MQWRSVVSVTLLPLALLLGVGRAGEEHEMTQQIAHRFCGACGEAAEGTAFCPACGERREAAAVKAPGNRFSQAALACRIPAFLYLPIILGPIGIILGVMGKARNEPWAGLASPSPRWDWSSGWCWG